MVVEGVDHSFLGLWDLGDRIGLGLNWIGLDWIGVLDGGVIWIDFRI